METPEFYVSELHLFEDVLTVHVPLSIQLRPVHLSEFHGSERKLLVLAAWQTSLLHIIKFQKSLPFCSPVCAPAGSLPTALNFERGPSYRCQQADFLCFLSLPAHWEPWHPNPDLTPFNNNKRQLLQHRKPRGPCPWGQSGDDWG